MGPDGGSLCIAVVDNLPEVPPEKFDKLTGILKKLFSQVRPIHAFVSMCR